MILPVLADRPGHPYEQAGIPEYWLIDPDARRAEFYTLDAEGRYVLVLRGASCPSASLLIFGFEITETQ